MNSNLSTIKVVVTDLDGTLLNPQHRISDYTKSIFEELHQQNYLIIVATGRHHLDAMAIIDALGVPVYLVSSNGARIHSPEKQELFSFNLKSEVVKAALSVEIDPEITVVLFKESVWQTNKLSEKLNAFQADLKYLPELVDYQTLEDFESIKIFFAHDNHEKLVVLKDAILQSGVDELHHAFSLPTCLEFMDKSVDKAVAIQRVLEKEGLSMQHAISFGDGFNDVQMLSATGKSLIMGNAPLVLKETLPHLEVIKTNAEDGVAKYIASKILNKEFVAG
ncbi:Cof-type HAD-IIB family hydrolase [Flavobacterium sp. Fl-77]|uniref:Cof-type HAD-IIB family hydrolase n=1 Tax=Flavobacterium flavipigmentatum TaxID=2893884 RepID=A0AAJ2SIS9_9FLAO|nr:MULTISPECIES: Cof-type HAD-IIB family hydrolase [unclassified Flavobacterium]MDX6183679.1 Cof-type HAD-IIB family hydrolase [Flavobacterium sp. Fl-33]MDX6187231.1 Cof-type HAD-IIB family hydrolase [Flavobacterium sp. Fl-77]UFH37959.1 Cof-type HAD-IIB family hydrolase [Flavobacterium sp. F-70]